MPRRSGPISEPTPRQLRADVFGIRESVLINSASCFHIKTVSGVHTSLLEIRCSAHPVRSNIPPQASQRLACMTFRHCRFPGYLKVLDSTKNPSLDTALQDPAHVKGHMLHQAREISTDPQTLPSVLFSSSTRSCLTLHRSSFSRGRKFLDSWKNSCKS